ncbi:MAG: hypothetical protein JRM97_07845 [Nitrososphaerota archaeon]|jgi:hypothetical protein|nr:hypothetical protein [Nitrososphaerota archaeon]MDG6938234.1 hypothetical protein [Nitrososphaerota archaeon]MDG6993832.1 hypothetical protein [Nitrososphaerota archaeon]MDG7017230.1 hypothetical protein [Nitrososphaerota archaeon]MDG7019412.1 hypothetical protein [Nitrososphaerota archaeon]
MNPDKTAQDGGPKLRDCWSGRELNTKFVLWWTLAWAVVIMALSPIVNDVTPFLNPAYNNQWTPDFFYRLILYWHGGLFLPWVVVLATLAYLVLGLDEQKMLPTRALRAALFWAALVAVPLAGVGGVFNVTDSFALGIPHWMESSGFAFLDLIALALIASMLVYPRVSGKGYGKVGLPFYVILLGVVGSFVAAFLGYIGAYITIAGPSPATFANYINSTTYPVLGYYNSTAVVTFTENVLTSHSHTMLPMLMAGVVALVAMVYGYQSWPSRERLIASFGFVIMICAMIATIWIYWASGVGNFSIPSLLTSGPGGINGVAEDDLVTGFVGLGAVFVLIALLMHAVGARTRDGRSLIRDPLFLSVIAAWVIIYLVIPVTGYYIEFNESFYSAAGAGFDAAFTRFHNDFAFFLLPALVTTALVFETSGMEGKARRWTGYLYLSGMMIAFVFGEAYAMVTLDPLELYLAAFGGLLMGLGVILGMNNLRKSYAAAPSSTPAQG